jgi:non-heme chloroperoxidase
MKASYFITSDETQIYFATNFNLDEEDEHEIILLNYGLVCSNHHWRELIPFLHKKNYKVLIHDYRGHFQSDGKNNIERLTFKQFAIDLIELCDAHRIKKVHAIGHSMGVNVTLELARLAPQLVKSQTLISGTVLPITEIMFDSNAMSFVIPIVKKIVSKFKTQVDLFWKSTGHNAIVREIIHRQGFNYGNVSSEFIQIYLNRMSTLGPEVFFQLYDEMIKHDIICELETLTQPTLVIGGIQDKVIPNHIQRLLQHSLPNSELYLVEGGSHVPQIDFPELINDRINLFLKLIDAKQTNSLIQLEA